MYIDSKIEDYKVFQEYYDLKKEVNALSDAALVEECEEIYCYNEDSQVAEILYKFWTKEKLIQDNRNLLESYYILSYCKLFFME